jgi:S-adenosylmethionine hydrolase
VLIGPDNGVLLPAARRAGGISAAIVLDPGKIDFRAPLATFHARDVLAPAAAALACGVEPKSLGEPVDGAELTPAPFDECHIDGAFVMGEVLEADRFGSLRFNVPSERMEELGLKGSSLEIALGHNALTVPLGKTYADVSEGEPVALVDSSGWLTLAVNRGDARDRFGAGSGTAVRIRAVT